MLNLKTTRSGANLKIHLLNDACFYGDGNMAQCAIKRQFCRETPNKHEKKKFCHPQEREV